MCRSLPAPLRLLVLLLAAAMLTACAASGPSGPKDGAATQRARTPQASAREELPECRKANLICDEARGPGRSPALLDLCLREARLCSEARAARGKGK